MIGKQDERDFEVPDDCTDFERVPLGRIEIVQCHSHSPKKDQAKDPLGRDRELFERRFGFSGECLSLPVAIEGEMNFGAIQIEQANPIPIILQLEYFLRGPEYLQRVCKAMQLH